MKKMTNEGFIIFQTIFRKKRNRKIKKNFENFENVKRFIGIFLKKLISSCLFSVIENKFYFNIGILRKIIKIERCEKNS